MHASTITIDGCNYGIEDVQLPQLGPGGVPTGAVIDVKQLVFVVANPVDGSVLRVNVRWLPEQYEEFLRQISGKKVIVGSSADLAKLNNGSG